jgi:hypothetical protein
MVSLAGYDPANAGIREDPQDPLVFLNKDPPIANASGGGDEKVACDKQQHGVEVVLMVYTNVWISFVTGSA